MALFKMRKGGDESPATRHPPESIEAMRKRARHRLIGAAVLVLIGVIGFPLLFDTQPRPIAVDIPIEIPDRNKVKPLAVPAQPAAQSPAVSGPVTVAPAPPAPPEKVVVAPPLAPAEPAPARPEVQPLPQPEPPAPKPAARSDDGVKAKALLE
ncbi:MAG TPA: SPOR domain-containing protein, partial [Ramlibacter sp.]|nr:SPOR domain-containing protein [Ramlibacter sp.]